MNRVKSAFEIVKKYPIPLFAIPFAYSALELGFFTKYMVAHGIMTNPMVLFAGDKVDVQSISLILLSMLFSAIFATGYIPMILIAVDGGQLGLSSFKIFLTGRRLWKIILLSLIVFPLSVLTLSYGFIITVMAYPIIVSSSEAKVVESIKRSIVITEGSRFKIFCYMFVYCVLEFLIFNVPVIFAVVMDMILTPLFYIVLALLYRECMNKHAQ